VQVSPRPYVVVLLVTIFLGFLGVHRFVVGKVGTGLLFLFTSGLFVIGWIVDIIVVATGSFQDKEGRFVTWKGTSTGTASGFVPDPNESLEFMTEGAAPERDQAGRIVVRLGSGSQFDVPVHWIDNADIDAITDYVRGSRALDDDGTLTRRFRLDPTLTDYWGGRCYRLDTPSGIPAFEIRDFFPDRFGLIQHIISEATGMLRALDSHLASADFVFDVAVRVDYTLGDPFDDEEEISDLELENPSVRIRNPLNIQVRSASS